MSIGAALAIIAGFIIAIILATLAGMYLVINYLTSPTGFVRDLVGGRELEIPPSPPRDPMMMRMHLEALQKEEK